MAYDENNVFARIIKGELPCHKIYETDHALAFMDVMPRAPGHALVIPKAKARNILDIGPGDLAKVMEVAQLVSRAAVAAFDADGISIIQSNEGAGGQVVFHMHVHVIPRFTGVELRPHTSKMEDSETLAAHAKQLRLALDGL